MKTYLFFFFLAISTIGFGQTTRVFGIVKDAATDEPLPLVKVHFVGTKIGTSTDFDGKYAIESYYASDSIRFSAQGYLPVTMSIQLDTDQEINISLPVLTTNLDDITVTAPDEKPSTTLHKRVVKNKPINDKEKLESYEYEVYNKVQVDLNNIGEKFENMGIVKKLDLITNYLDSTAESGNFLPLILSENISDFYYRNNPKKKKEVVKATRISGVENVTINQFLGDMYLDVNIYDNYLNLFNKSFISPVANFARAYYTFYLTDSTFIDNQWCYKLTFTPKRTGDATFEGEMWIHDTTYAVKQFSARMSPWVNINYVQDLYIEHHFNQVEHEVWMLTSEKMFADLKITKKTGVYGFFGHRYSTRTNYKINEKYDGEFYRSDNTVEILDSASQRSEEYWAKARHLPLTEKENDIDEMVDSLNTLPFFNTLKNLLYFATTGYYPLGKIELGSAFSLFSMNQVEKFRFGLALRTSNDFSHRIELGGNLAYGTFDERFKYGGLIRINLSEKKRNMLRLYYNYDIEQIGIASSAASVTSSFGSILRTGPLDKLTFVERFGLDIEKDIMRDIVIFGSAEWKEYTPLGLANYIHYDSGTDSNYTVSNLQTTEFTLRYRWAKNEEFISGYFDRSSVGSKYPILAMQGTFGVKNILGSDYDYQRIEIIMEHNAPIGILGRIKYGANAGYIFGKTAYPFLKVHEANQSFWLSTSAFNKMNYFEFISDRYVSAFIENHWDGFFLDRVPLMKKLKWRLVTTTKAVYGLLSDRHSEILVIPDFVKSFGNIPYVETAVGVENIFKVGRVDVFWRLTHKNPGESPFGFRFRYYINF